MHQTAYGGGAKILQIGLVLLRIMDSQMHELRHYSILFIANELLLQFNLFIKLLLLFTHCK